MTQHELDLLEKDARRPDRGSKYYKPVTVLALIEEVKAARMALWILLLCRIPQQGDLFDQTPE